MRKNKDINDADDLNEHYVVYDTIQDFVSNGYDKKKFPLIFDMLNKNENYENHPNGGSVTVQCDEDDKPIGIGVMLNIDENTFEIAAFEILEEYRGQGFGSNLLRKILGDYSSNDIFVYVRAKDAKAAKFYYKWMDVWFKVSYGKDLDGINYVVYSPKERTVEQCIKILKSNITSKDDKEFSIRVEHEKLEKVDETLSMLPPSMLFVLNESMAKSEQDESLGSAIRSTVAAGALAAGSFMPGTAMASSSREERAIRHPRSSEVATPSVQSKRPAVMNYSKEQERNIIARTLYRECMGTEGEAGMRAVATVIFNRGNGNSAEMVKEIKAPRQFSCWNKMSVSDWMPENFKIKTYPNDKWWKLADSIASEMFDGTFKPVADYDHYHTVSVSPYWSKGKISQAVKIGNHFFFPSGVIA